MSQFDPQAFLDVSMEEALEKREVLPVGDYTAIIGEVSARAWTGKKDPTKSGIAWDLPKFFETAEMVQANHVDHLQCEFHPVHPPAVAGLLHGVPAV